MDHKRCEYCSEITAPLFANEEGHLICEQCSIDWNDIDNLEFDDLKE